MTRKQTPTYISWQAMKQRCDNPRATGYDYYGGRGISYDPRWTDFRAFLEDMGERPAGLTLDRIDSEGSYSRSNCRWATLTEQRGNRRPTVIRPETISSGEFRKTYAKLEEPTLVTANGHVIGLWQPMETRIGTEWSSDLPQPREVARPMPKMSQAQRDAILRRVNRAHE